MMRHALRGLILALATLGSALFPAHAAGYRVETVAGGLEHPWSLAFLPGGRILVTERPGRLRVIEPSADGRLALRAAPVAGVPTVLARGQAGLFDVLLHPGFASNGWLYLGTGNAASAIALGPVGRVYATGIETVQLTQAYEPLPPKLKLIKINGQNGVAVMGEIGETYPLEVSDDLAKWTPFVSPRLTTNRRDFVDPGAAGKRCRFYRLAPAN